MSPDHGKGELDSTRSFKYIAAGAVIAHYRIIEKIGEGAMGQVYLAEDTRLKRRVALKFLPYDLTRDEEAKKRFLQEARAAANLDHPHICNIHEIEETSDGQVFICMAHYDGETLKQTIAGGPLGVEETLEIAIQFCDGLSRAHEAGVVHRDIKPGNIMITQRGRVKILDFGLAKLAGETQLTRTGITVGTALYMSPEQARGQRVDQRSDIWSAGVVLYEMLTGSRPFKGANSTAVIYSILHDDPDPVTHLSKDLPRGVANIVERCLRKDPAERYQTAADLRDDISAFADELGSDSVIAVPIPAFARADRVRKVAVPVGIAMLAVILVFTTPLRHRLASWFEAEKTIGERRVAILAPTEPELSGDEAAFCRGIIAYLGGRLSQLEKLEDSLWVIRTPDYIDLSLAPSRVCSIAGANVAITGSVSCTEDSIRLTLVRGDLLHGGWANHTAAVSLHDHRGNLQTWQDSAATELARMLDVAITPEVRRELSLGRTRVPAAFESYLLGEGYLESWDEPDNLDSAVRALRRSTEYDLSYALAFAGLGKAHRYKYYITREEAFLDTALSACEQALQIERQLPPALVTEGLVYSARGDSVKALTTLWEASALDTLYQEPYRRMAAIYQSLGLADSAEAMYLRAIHMRPRDVSSYSNLARHYWYAGEFEHAAEQFEMALVLAPINPRVCDGLGASYWQTGKVKEAIEIWKRLARIQPSAVTFGNLGRTCFYEAQYAEAARMFEMAVRMEDDMWHEYVGFLAECYYWIPGKRDTSLALFGEAARVAEEGLAGNPGDPGDMANLASYYVPLGKRVEARALVDSAAQQDPSEEPVMFTVGEVYEALGERDLALTWLTAALGSGYGLRYVLRSPKFGNLRADPDFWEIPELKEHREKQEARTAR